MSVDVGRELSARIGTRGWSGRELARRANLPTTSTARKLTGVSAITLGELAAFAGALEVAPRDLLPLG